MTIKKQNVLLFLATLFCFGTAFSQQYSFIDYSIKEGLAQTQANAICQDRYGYLWVATSSGGVSRFDGQSFVTFTTEDGLIDNRAFTIFRDSKDRIWVGSRGGISVYESGKFTNLYLDESHQDTYIISIDEDAKGNLWLGTAWWGVIRYDGENFDYFDVSDGLADQSVRSIMVDRNDNVWLGIVGGLSVVRKDSIETSAIPELFGSNIGSLLEGPDGDLWIGTAGDGLLHWDGEQLDIFDTSQGLISNNVESLFMDSRGVLWACTMEGISKYANGQFTSFGKEEGLPFPAIKAGMEDNEGNLWFCSDGGGIFRFAGEGFVNFTIADGMCSDYMMGALEADNGSMWFSTYDAGVCVLEDDHFLNFGVVDGLGDPKVWCNLKDSQNNLWFGTSNGLSLYQGNNSFQTFRREDGLGDVKITALAEGPDQNLWIGHREGVSIYDGTTFKNYGPDEGFLGQKIRNIVTDREGTLWFAAQNGLFRYKDDAFREYSTNDGLPHQTVHCLAEDSRGHLWIGTAYQLGYYDGEQFKSFRLARELNSNVVQFLVFDIDEQLWIGTNNGVFRLDVPKYYETGEAEFILYSDLDGIKSLETNLNSGYRDGKGHIWMGTSLGTVRYDPSKEKIIAQEVLPFINITGVRLFLEETDWSKYSDSVSSEGLPYMPILPHHQNYLTFDFTGISHTNPAKVRYRFKLENFDEDWSPVQNATFATYSNLPDGDYVFRVESMNKDQVWSKNNASFAFTIKTPYWKQAWFIFLCALGFGSIVFLIYRSRRLARLRKMERGNLINRSKMLALEQQTLNASMNRHFIFNALNSIQYYINRQDRLAANRYLTSFAKLVRKNLDSSQSNMVALSEELERLKLYLSLEHMRFQNKFNYNIEVDEKIDAEAINIPSMLLQPYVENSIWHGLLPLESPEGLIEVNVTTDGESLIFTIDDNGIGIETSLSSKEVTEKDHISKGMSITNGRINLMREMTNEKIYVHGPFEVKNDKNEAIGTRVEIVLPYNNAYLSN